MPGLDAVKPDIAFTSFGAFRRLFSIEVADVIHRHQQRIDQHVFCGHGMRRHAGKADLRRRRVEVLKHDFTQLAAVDSPGKIDVKAFQIKRLRPA
ncbi:hypothetical protein D3C80_1646310 [compost metagenome]